MGKTLEHIIGPRVPAEELAARRLRYRLPSAILTVARLSLLISDLPPLLEDEAGSARSIPTASSSPRTSIG